MNRHESSTLRIPQVLLCCLLLLGFLACAKPVPPEKAAYVGHWTAPGTSLVILQEGNVEYEHKENNSSTQIKGPIQSFEGDHFSVGISFLSKRFEVSKPPYQEGNTWKMVVEGVELTRAM